MPCYNPPPPYEDKQKRNAEQAVRILCGMCRNASPVTETLLAWYIDHLKIDIEQAKYWKKPEDLAIAEAELRRVSP